MGGGARAAAIRKRGAVCERCGLEWPWLLFLYLIDPAKPAHGANLRVLCGPCSAGESGAYAPLITQPTLRERMRESNNRRTGAAKLTAARRRKLIAARGGCCEMCGVTGAERQLQVHHRVAVLRGGDDSEANLLVLCFACHHHVQPCAGGCGRWAKKPSTLCSRCRTERALAAWVAKTAARNAP